ncbi:MAG TPA: ABC transporter permease [Armatimonadota bacterium]|jgi:simple sugar transport system permease protein
MKLLVTILASTMSLSAPLILAAMGGILSERSGVVIIALEGMMLGGAFAAIAFGSTGGVLAGLFAALIVGALLGLLHAAATQKMRIGAIVSGVAINILASGFTGYLSKVPSIPKEAEGPSIWNIPVLCNIPVLGDVLFRQSPFTYFAWITVAAMSFFLWRTPWGLRVTAAGENPEAVKAAGINVVRLRFGAVMAAGMLAALGGAQLSLGLVQNFTDNMTAGRGFIALAAIVFGRWRPGGALIACVFFAFADALQSGLQLVPGIGNKVPSELLAMLPYVATLVALVFFSKQVQAPAATGDTGD